MIHISPKTKGYVELRTAADMGPAYLCSVFRIALKRLNTLPQRRYPQIGLPLSETGITFRYSVP